MLLGMCAKFERTSLKPMDCMGALKVASVVIEEVSVTGGLWRCFLPIRSIENMHVQINCQRIPWCSIILKCWWWPYGMNDENVWSLAHTLFIQRCQGLLFALAWNTQFKAPFIFLLHMIDKLVSFCWWKSILKFLGAPPEVWTEDLQCSMPGSYH